MSNTPNANCLPVSVRKPRRHGFNLIELVLAIGLVAVGLCSIMALFPIGIAASRDAMAEGYAADAAEQMLMQLKYACKANQTNWENYVGESGTGFDTSYLPDDQPGSSKLETFVHTDTSISVDIGSPQKNIFRKISENGVYKILSFRDIDGGGKLDDNDEIDFEAIMAVWQDPININGTDISRDIGVRLNLEVSWPAQRPYDVRQKSLYVLEVFNRN
jgi:type II secretory pathway pseudopilin PulG